MTKRKAVISLIVMLILSLSATFAYMVSSLQSNSLTFQIGTPSVQTASINRITPNNYLLVPYGSLAIGENEIDELHFTLRVDMEIGRTYTFTTNLPPQFQVTTDGISLTTNREYQLYVRLLEPIELTQQTFYVYIDIQM